MENKININLASLKDLMKAKGIGPVVAQKIINAREKGTTINSVGELKAIGGIQPQFVPEIGSRFSFGEIDIEKPTGVLAGSLGGPSTQALVEISSFDFSIQLSGLESYEGYRVEITYFYYAYKSTKLVRGKRTIEIKKGVDAAKTGKLDVGINVVGSFPKNPRFRIAIISPKRNVVFNAEFRIQKDEELKIELANYSQKDLDYKIRILKPQGDPDEIFTYKDFKLAVNTQINRGTGSSNYIEEYLILPDFEVDIEISDADSIEFASLQIKTPRGESINSQTDQDGNIQTWTKLSLQEGNPLWDKNKRILSVSLPAPNQLTPDVYLNERLEKGLDVWADHKLVMKYDILDKETLEFAARIEEEYDIYTDINDADKRGKAQVKLEYYGIVERINFEVKSPRGEIIGKGVRLPQEIIDNGNEIEIEVPPRRIEEIIDLKIFPDRPKKSVGRVIDFFGRKKFEEVQVIIYAAEKPINPGDDLKHYPIITTTTETGGYFVITTPEKFYEDAYAVIGVEGQDLDSLKIPIRLEQDNIIEKVVEENGNGDEVITERVVKENFFPAKFILVIEPDFLDDEDDDCDCGDCKELDFHKPRKVLEEFSYYSIVRTTEPQIRGYTLVDGGKMEIGSFKDLIEDIDTEEDKLPENFESLEIEKSILLKYINNRKGLTVQNLNKAISESRALKLKEKIKPRRQVRAIGRNILDATNPIDWDEDPTIYQATSLAHGHILHFKQEWINDGFSLGDLLYSLPLAPGQKKQIVVFDWERREAASGSEILDYKEGLYNSLGRDRDINEIVAGTVGEQSAGGSTARTSSKSEGGGVAGGLGFALGPVVIGGGGAKGWSSGSSSASSNAWQKSSRSSTLNSLQQLRDKTTQSANATRSQRSTVIQTASQGERFSVETETVANYNHCHALTIEYFEVLRHFQIQSRLSDVQECLFVPLEMSTFDSKKALRWREILSRFLLNDPYSRRLETRRFIRGVRNPLRRGFDAIERRESLYENSNLPTGIYADESINYVEGSLYLRFQLSRPLDKVDEDGNEIIDTQKWRFLRFILPNRTVAALRERYIREEINRRDFIFQTKVSPEIAEAFVQHLKVEAVLENDNTVDLEIDATLLSRFQDNRNLQVSLRMADTNFDGLRRSDIKFIRISTDVIGDDGSYVAPSDLLPENSRVIVSSGFMSYKTDHLSSYLFRNSRINNDMTGLDNVQIYTPLNRIEERNPRMEDEELAEALIDHLNDNLEYYHGVIWMRMNPRRRFMFLDGIQVVDYSESDVYPDGVVRSVASVVENRVIGIEGNCLIMPVAPGFRLDPNIKGQEIDFLELYKPPTPIEPMNVSIPTKGVFAEAVMGKCNSCEKKEEDRFWRWEESPIPDSPTAIQPVSTDSRRAEPLDTRPTELPSPVVNIQNAPAAPNPTGLAALSQLLANPNFENITGLDGNQRNALEGLLASFDTTTAFGNMATQLASEGMFLSSQLEAIRKSKENNDIDEPTANELTKRAINRSIDYGGGGGNTDVSQGLSQIRQLNDMVQRGELAPEIGRDLTNRVLDNISRNNSSLIENPAIQDRIKEGNSLEYSSDEENIVLGDSKVSDGSPDNSLLKFTVNLRRPRMFTRTNGDANESKVEVAYAGHFGFDWLRDEYIYPIETVTHDLDNHAFPPNTKKPLCSDEAKLKAEYLKGVPNKITPYGKEYYPAWLSIFPPRGIPGFGKGSRMHEQGVKLSLEIDEIDVLDKRDNTIEFRSTNGLLTIEPANIKLSDVISKGKKQTKILDSSKGKSRTYWFLEDALTIKSKKGLLNSHAEIRVFAKGADKEEEIGKLMVYQNDRIPKAELVMVRVAYDDVNVNLNVQYHDILKNQSFNQALIRAEVVADEKFIINNLDATDADVIAFKAAFPDTSPKTMHDSGDFLDALLKLYQKLGNNNPPAGSKRSIIFITNQQGDSGGVTQDFGYAAGKFVWGNAVVVFNSNLSSRSSFAHEIGHSLSLAHTFDNDPKDAGIRHKFYRGYTDNYMDYTTKFDGTNNAHPRLYFCKWQWDIMRGDQSLIDNY